MGHMSTQQQLDVWQWVLGKYISVGQVFTNPLRPDPKAGCFLRDYNGILFLTDYSWPEYSKYTCIHAVRDLMHCNLTQASMNIYAALYFNKPLKFNTSITVGTRQKGRKSGLKIHIEPWTKDKVPTYTRWDKEYWDGTEVTFDDLRKNNIFSIHHFFLGNTMIIPDYPTYGYYKADTGHVKIHQTQAAKGDRFIGTTNLSDIWEFNVDKENVILTKSVKDALILSKQLPEWRIINFNNEGVLSEYSKVDLVLYDNDFAGIKAANKAAEKFGAKPIFLESAKDCYDVIKQHGMNVLQEELKQLIK